MVDRLVDLPQDLRQARGDAGQPRTARADDRIARSRFGGEDRRVLGTAGDLDIGDTAQEVGFEVGRRVLLDDDIVLDRDGDADLLGSIRIFLTRPDGTPLYSTTAPSLRPLTGPRK
jgi:hypothetical protein